MAVRLTCTDNASGHDGLRWRMGPDAQSVTTVVGETAPGVGELVVFEPITPDACFSVAAYSGGEESNAASICAETAPKEVLDDGAVVGDYANGGVYAGINTESDNTQYHIIFGMQESEIGPGAESRWKTSRTGTLGTDSETDGWANTEAMVVAGVADHPAAQYCINYTDAAGNSDYYLPSRAELALEENLRGHPELSTNTTLYRWSSWQVTSSGARGRHFLGQELTINKDFTNDGLVRPVRRVPV